MQADAQHVGRRPEQSRGHAGKERRHGRVSRDHGPVPVHRERRVGRVRRKNRLDGLPSGAEVGVVEPSIAQNRREARREQQRVALARGHREALGQVQHHLPAGRRAPGLDAAQVALRDARLGGEMELAEAATSTPLLKEGSDAGSGSDFAHGAEIGAGRLVSQ